MSLDISKFLYGSIGNIISFDISIISKHWLVFYCMPFLVWYKIKIINCKKLFFLAYKYIHNCKIMRSNKKLPGHRWNMSNIPQKCQHQVIKNVQMNGRREGKAFSQLSDVMMAFQQQNPKSTFLNFGNWNVECFPHLY